MFGNSASLVKLKLFSRNMVKQRKIASRKTAERSQYFQVRSASPEKLCL
jgi:hypothetical protein